MTFNRFKRKKKPRSIVAIIKSGLDSFVENIMSSRLNLTIDMRINAPLIVVIISDKANDMVTLDLGFIEMKSGKMRKICNVNDVKESYHNSKFMQSSNITGHPISNNNSSNNNINSNNQNDNMNNNNINDNNNNNNDINNNNNNISQNGSYDDDDYSVSGARYTVSIDDKEYGNEIASTDEASYNVTNISFSEIEVSLLSITRSKDCSIKNTNNQNQNQNQNQTQNNHNAINNINNMNNMTNLIRRSRLIEKFDVNIEVQLSDDPWGSSCPPIRLFIDLPKISVRYVLKYIVLVCVLHIHCSAYLLACLLVCLPDCVYMCACMRMCLSVSVRVRSVICLVGWLNSNRTTFQTRTRTLSYSHSLTQTSLLTLLPYC